MVTTVNIEKKSGEIDGVKREWYEITMDIDEEKIRLYVKAEDKALFKYLMKQYEA